MRANSRHRDPMDPYANQMHQQQCRGPAVACSFSLCLGLSEKVGCAVRHAVRHDPIYHNSIEQEASGLRVLTLLHCKDTRTPFERLPAR